MRIWVLGMGLGMVVSSVAPSRAAAHPGSLLERGIQEARQGRGHAEAAIALLSQVLAREPKNVEALYYRGSARLMEDDLDGAAADLDAALALSPRHGWAHFLRGQVASEAGRLHRGPRPLHPGPGGTTPARARPGLPPAGAGLRQDG